MDGGGLHTEPAGDLDWSQPLAPPQSHDLTNQRRAGLVRTGVRSRAAVDHACLAFNAVAISPLLRRPRGDHEHLGRRGVSPATVDDELSEPQTGAWGQGSVSVGHEGLRSVKR